MILDVYGHALRLLDDFVYYANAYPGKVSAAMSYYEEAFVAMARCLKKAYDEAAQEERRRNHYRTDG